MVVIFSLLVILHLIYNFKILKISNKLKLSNIGEHYHNLFLLKKSILISSL
jgi:hypothetical protein